MKGVMKKRRNVWYGAGLLVIVLGWVAAAVVLVVTVRACRDAIAAANLGPQQKIEVPGTAELELEREGAYGIYYEGHRGAYVQAAWPPRLDCHLTAKATGADVPLTPDYAPGNRYSTRDSAQGVLIYSTTVPAAGRYTLSCEDPVGTGTAHTVAIGPNYVFEVLRLAWRVGGYLLGTAAVLCAATVLSLVFAVATVTLFLLRVHDRKREGEAGA